MKVIKFIAQLSDFHALTVAAGHIRRAAVGFVLLVAVFALTSAAARAATITVNSLADTQANDGSCTLREAIFNARADNQSGSADCPAGAGADTINITTAGTISLFALLPTLTNDVTINGLGAANTIIARNSGAATEFRIFTKTAGTSTISNLTVRDGIARGATAATGGPGNGGGINNTGGQLTLTNVTVTNNRAIGGLGTGGVGGAANGGGVSSTTALIVSGSIISGNATVSSGGGILTNSGVNLTLTNSTVSGNSTGFIGGGIYNLGTLTVTNSTVSGNTTTGTGSIGGGISNNGTATLDSVTISNNSAPGSGSGVLNTNGTMTLNNTIVANSISSGDCGRAGGTVNATYSLIENNLTCVNGTNTNNLTGDPNLGALANNGGSTQTHALLPGSIAIDTGNTTLTTDQRGLTRPFDNPNVPNATNGNGADIGAFEAALGITAATVSVSGRVITQSGRGIRNIVITMTDSQGYTRTATTTSFGYYRFEEVAAGGTYIFTARGKRFPFRQNTQVHSITEETNDINFVAGEQPLIRVN